MGSHLLRQPPSGRPEWWWHPPLEFREQAHRTRAETAAPPSSAGPEPDPTEGQS
jgi:hypothetical protein